MDESDDDLDDKVSAKEASGFLVLPLVSLHRVDIRLILRELVLGRMTQCTRAVSSLRCLLLARYCLCQSGFSRESEPRGCVFMERKHGTYFKNLARTCEDRQVQNLWDRPAGWKFLPTRCCSLV